MKPSTGSAWIAAGVALATAASAAHAQERYSLSGDVAIFNLAGEVRIEPGTGGGIVVEVTRGGQEAERLDIQTSEMRGWQTLRVRYPEDRIVYPSGGRGHRVQIAVREDGTFGDFDDDDSPSGLRELLEAIGIGGRGRRVRISGSGDGLEAWADLRVLVPAGRSVSVNLGVGTIVASNVDGDLYIDTHAGSVSTSGTSGALRVDTGSGSIDVANARGDVDLDTGSGDIAVRSVTGGALGIDTGSGRVRGSDLDVTKLEVDTGSGSIELTGVRTAYLEGDTGSGSISIEATRVEKLLLDTGSGSVDVALDATIRSASIDTGSGSVTLTIPADVSATLELDSGSGGVEVELPVRVIERERNYLRAALGNGEGQIRIDTASGGIHIRELR